MERESLNIAAERVATLHPKLKKSPQNIQPFNSLQTGFKMIAKNAKMFPCQGVEPCATANYEHNERRKCYRYTSMDDFKAIRRYQASSVDW
jgi:hypothetical protein